MKANKKRVFGVKTPHFVITTIVASILVLLFGIWIWGKSTSLSTKLFNQPTITNTVSKGTVKYVEPEGSLPYLYKEKEDGTTADDFKVMVLADTHFLDVNQEFTFTVLDRYIQHENPDLVVFIGDVLFRVQDFKWQKKLNDYFEEKNLYWTFCLGNHDSEGWSFYQHKPIGESRQIAFKSLNGELLNDDGKPSPHCLARSSFNTENSYGNHFINIKGSTGILETLFLFDYRDYQFKNDGLVNWYKNSIDQITNENGGVTPKSVAFGHVPMYEAKYVFENIGKDPEIEYISGVNTEGIRMPHVNSGLFDAFVEKGSTDRMMFGHYHINNLCAKYKGVNLCFTSSLAYNCYTLRNNFHWSFIFGLAHMLDDSISLFNDGVTNLYVQKDSDAQMQHVFAQHTDWAFKGLENDLYFMTNLLVTYKGHWFTIVNRICLPIAASCVISYYTLFAIYHIKRKRGK